MPIYLPRSASPFLSPRYARSGSRSLAFLWFDFRSTGVQQGGRSEDGGLKSANEYEAAGPSGLAPFSFSNEHGPGTREISQVVDAADDLWGGTQQQPMDCDEREEDEMDDLRRTLTSPTAVQRSLTGRTTTTRSRSGRRRPVACGATTASSSQCTARTSATRSRT